MDAVLLFRGLFILTYLLMVAFQIILDKLNLNHLKKNLGIVPRGFEGEIDSKDLVQMQEYTAAKTKFTLIKTLASLVLLFWIVFAGPLHFLVDTAQHFTSSLAQGLIFFLLLGGIYWLFSLPFDLWENFRLEERFGFNTLTPSLWLKDLIKSTLISLVLGGIVLTLLLLLVYKGGRFWWLYAWVAVFILGLGLVRLYPVLIAPLFNKFIPLENEALRKKLTDLLTKFGIETKEVLRMDAEKRSTHSNAYFTGLGKSKRIVLFDTLLKNMSEEEILAVIAHEAGHWKYKHIWKGMFLTQIYSLLWFWVASIFLQNSTFYQIFHLSSTPLWAGLFLLSIVWQPVNFLASPLFLAYSRKNETQADDAAVKRAGLAKAFCQALVKLSKDNLANLDPHPLYAFFHYSHPAPARRIQRLLSEHR